MIASITDVSGITGTLSSLFARFPGLQGILTQYIRYALVILALMTVISCIASLLREKYTPELWGTLRRESGDTFLLTHWENILGRAPASDIRIPEPTVARMQAAVTRSAHGVWTLYPLDGRHPILKNGERITHPATLAAGDTLTVGDVPSGAAVNLTFEP